MKVCILVENHFRGGVDNVISTLLNNGFGEDTDLALVTNCNNPTMHDLKAGIKGLARIIHFEFIS